MRRIALVALTLVLVLGLAVPTFATPPFEKNDNAGHGLGRMFGEHISGEAKAGRLGPDLHPGMHHGFAGWSMPMTMQ